MDDYDLFKLSIQSALIGVITENLVAVTCGIRSRHLIIEAYFDGSVTPDAHEVMHGIVKEVVADFPDRYTIEGHCHSLQDRPARMLDFWAFLREKPNRRTKAKILTVTRAMASGS